MTEFSEKKPDDKTFQLEGVFCFHSNTRLSSEYDTTVYKIGHGAVTVNYYGTLLSDGTPGGIAGNEFVRPDRPETYVLIGKVVPNNGGNTVLEEVDLKREIALQSGLPFHEPAPNPAPKQRAEPAEQNPEKKSELMKQFEENRKRRKAFDRKENTRLRQHKNNPIPRKK